MVLLFVSALRKCYVEGFTSRGAQGHATRVALAMPEQTDGELLTGRWLWLITSNWEQPLSGRRISQPYLDDRH